MRWLVLVMGLLLAPRASDACMEPASSASPEAGTVLPPNPRVLVFVPTVFAPRFTANVPFEQRVVSSSPGVHVYELHFAITDGDLVLGLPGRTSWWYPIRESRTPRTPRIRGISTLAEGGGFYFDAEDGAIGFRIDWHAGGESKWFTSWYMDERSALHQLRSFDFVALFADGSERRIGTSEMMVSDSAVRRPVELLDRSWPMFAGPWLYQDYETAAWEPGPQDVDDPRWRGLLGLALLLVAWWRSR